MVTISKTTNHQPWNVQNVIGNFDGKLLLELTSIQPMETLGINVIFVKNSSKTRQIWKIIDFLIQAVEIILVPIVIHISCEKISIDLTWQDVLDNFNKIANKPIVLHFNNQVLYNRKLDNFLKKTFVKFVQKCSKADMKNHQQPTMQCPKCDRNFWWESSVRAHLNSALGINVIWKIIGFLIQAVEIILVPIVIHISYEKISIDLTWQDISDNFYNIPYFRE
jgi:hypothetical protein